ncbi:MULTISPECIES: acetolactate synthase large subunit [Mycobacterium]|uniref:acetolactate synthase n=2 Tax=Mycobacterium kiyosense TaxID=2871094 RepID=A0A9P3V0J5_9MYCO|nr:MULTISPECIES: acetolactate synthase large subunit [Mycobacterium]BDB45220.1 putative acetolactate synthase large subunit IlvX [Mycobacterium kiyosense]BDE16694.1 putative acetolactate synthase large subunit IlvX [Mycobacterium sp. 20KCMC460]GLB86885.1 putative acetolactate synthase large subunit IlvX [Mycobacterium kiyosense]GLB93068.1 putative acetolactate synthase large subunit IlvX [Mycobacterium kiyosense]GLB99311.1 putative acetolactate synthase large subunit IlvX [Mycobacterium kiyose
MNGAQALIKTLVDGGVDVCFSNPGTSEMHFVAALDTVDQMRGVLTLFEGVATGAADGYARIAGRPAAVLLHLGPGLGNGLANLHNARRARVPMVVVVGDHATYHKKYDAPLESDIDSVAGTVSGWVRRTATAAEVGADAAEAIATSLSNSHISTLILPADTSWSEGGQPVTPVAVSAAAAPADVRAVAEVLRSGEPTTILVGGDATRAAGLAAAARIGAATGARLLCETFPTRLERGAGVPAIERLGYFAEAAAAQLTGSKHLVLAGAKSPVSFFAYPDMPSDLVPAGCEVHALAEFGGAAAALTALADEVAPGVCAPVAAASRPALPSGALTAASAADVVGALLPERAIVVDESNTSGLLLPAATAGAPAHDWLTLTGGAIGYGIPTAVGAAVAAPDRPVLCLESDGSAMYTISGLWTQARENLDVTTVIYNNGRYDILRLELQRVGAGSAPGPKALDLLDISRPTMDFVHIAQGMGVPARRATTAEELAEALRDAFAEPGPHLIDAVVPSLLG